MNSRTTTPHPPRVPRRLTLEVYVRYEGDTIFARPQPLGERHLLCGGDIELFLVSNRDHRIKDRKTVRDIGGGPLPEVAFHTPENSFSAYSIAADVVDRHGHRFSAQVILESAGEEPEWFGSQEAVSLDVPAPWTSLECRRRRSGPRVTCWGREYDFAAGSLLHAVPVKPMTLEQLELMSAIWEVMDGFDRRAARWQAYWRENTGMTAGSGGVYASYYHHSSARARRGGRAMIGSGQRLRTGLGLEHAGRRAASPGRSAQFYCAAQSGALPSRLHRRHDRHRPRARWRGTVHPREAPLFVRAGETTPEFFFEITKGANIVPEREK